MTVKICYHCHPKGKPIFDLQAENVRTHNLLQNINIVKRLVYLGELIAHSLVTTYLMLGLGVFFLTGNSFNQVLAQSQGNATLMIDEIRLVDPDKGVLTLDTEVPVTLCADPGDTSALCSANNNTRVWITLVNSNDSVITLDIRK